MFQHLAEVTGSQNWAIASLIFFALVFLFIVVRLALADKKVMAKHAEIPLHEEPINDRKGGA